jgi:ribosomal protein S18 acetylase RimI-like enzyme
MVDFPLTELVLIRQANQEDLPALEWEGEYSHFRRLFAEAFQRAQYGKAVMWVAELPERGIIGQLFVQINGQEPEKNPLFTKEDGIRAYIYGFRVRPEYRRCGIGSRLLKIAETDLARRGFRKIALNVARDNRDARRLYERFGYRVVSAEPGIWSYLDADGKRQQVCEPAWRMEKRL